MLTQSLASAIIKLTVNDVHRMAQAKENWNDGKLVFLGEYRCEWMVRAGKKLLSVKALFNEKGHIRVASVRQEASMATERLAKAALNRHPEDIADLSELPLGKVGKLSAV